MASRLVGRFGVLAEWFTSRKNERRRGEKTRDAQDELRVVLRLPVSTNWERSESKIKSAKNQRRQMRKGTWHATSRSRRAIGAMSLALVAATMAASVQIDSRRALVRHI